MPNISNTTKSAGFVIKTCLLQKKTIQFYRGDPNLGFLKQFSHADMVRWNPVKNALIQNFRCEMELFAELLFLRETGNIIIAKYSSI